MKISINHELPDLNTEINYAKKHWSYYAKHKKQTTQLIAWHFKGKKAPPKPPFDFVFTWRCKNRRKDKDNIAFAIKYIFDGMVEAGFIPDDNWDYIGDISHKHVIDKDNVGVDVSIV